MKIMKVTGKNEYKELPMTIAIKFNIDRIDKHNSLFKKIWKVHNDFIALTKYGQIFILNNGDYLIKTSYVDKFTKMNSKEFKKNMKIISD